MFSGQGFHNVFSERRFYIQSREKSEKPPLQAAYVAWCEQTRRLAA